MDTLRNIDKPVYRYVVSASEHQKLDLNAAVWDGDVALRVSSSLGEMRVEKSLSR